MARQKRKNPPSYRLHRGSGRAVVTLTDRVNGHRRDVYLGEHGTPESRRRYAEVLRQWEADGRILDGKAPLPSARVSGSVRAIGLAYWLEIKSRYGLADGERGTGHTREVHHTLKLLRSVCGNSPAAEFGPIRLAEFRNFLAGQGLSRRTVRDELTRL